MKFESSFKNDCRQWLGDRPCEKQKGGVNNCEDCLFYSQILGNSLIMEAGGLGSILRTSVVAKEIKKEGGKNYQVQWITHEKGVDLLKNISSVDNAISCNENGNLLILQAQEYDKVINFESSPLFLALSKKLKSKEKLGFEMNKFGKLIPASIKSKEFLMLQTDDYFRKRINTKSMQQILLEAAGFSWEDQLYELITKDKDDEWARDFLYQKGLLNEKRPKIVGLNIGSSEKHKAKRWPIENFYNLADKFQEENPNWKFVILAGPDDRDAYDELNRIQSQKPLNNVIFSGDNNSISQFISLVNNIPIVISADTFGMHVAIGLRKNVISLHGPQPEQEIYLYNKGQKVKLNVECSPCFASKIDKCENTQRLQCMRNLDVNNVFNALKNEIKEYK